MNKLNFDVLLVCPERFPQVAIDKITGDVKAEGLEMKIVKRDFGMQASLEWAIPGVIAVYIAKSYFEGFLKEAGKDHYYILKKWLSDTAVSARLLKVKTITASTSPDKIDESNTQSKSISIFLETKDSVSIKLLLDERLTDEQWEEAIGNMVDNVRENIEAESNDDFISESIEKLKKENIHSAYGIINPDTLEWEVLDDLTLARRQYENQKKKSG